MRELAIKARVVASLVGDNGGLASNVLAHDRDDREGIHLVDVDAARLAAGAVDQVKTAFL
jgi:hypothetical protein